MFCYAPTADARTALEAYLATLPDEPDVSGLLLKERAVNEANLAVLLTRLGDSQATTAWTRAKAACSKAQYANCSEAALNKFATMTCKR
jgi:hypothetical protein